MVFGTKWVHFSSSCLTKSGSALALAQEAAREGFRNESQQPSAMALAGPEGLEETPEGRPMGHPKNRYHSHSGAFQTLRSGQRSRALAVWMGPQHEPMTVVASLPALGGPAGRVLAQKDRHTEDRSAQQKGR
jgi:hypothetical protein